MATRRPQACARGPGRAPKHPSPPQLLHISWLCVQPLLLHADPRPLGKAVWGFVLGGDARTMRRAFGSGALKYCAIIAVKPAGGEGGRPLPPAGPATDGGAVDGRCRL